MVSAQCPHCNHVIEAPSFPKGSVVICQKCQRTFLPIMQTLAEAKASATDPAASVPTTAPAPAPVMAPAVPAPPPVPAPAPSVAPGRETRPEGRPTGRVFRDTVAGSQPPPSAPPVEPGLKATRQQSAGPQRVKALACPKCRALLRLSGGEARFGKCQACGHVFVFDPAATTELVLPAAEIAELPALELSQAPPVPAAEEGAATIMRPAPAAASAPPRAKVRCQLVSDSARIRYEIEKDVVLIGRVGADLTLNDPDVSRRHATIEQSGGKVIVRDLKSTNGTFVNGVRVELEVLKDGDRIKMGSTELRLVIVAEGERGKHAALFLDLGAGTAADDVRQALDLLQHWVPEEFPAWKPDVILSPSTGRAVVIGPYEATASADARRRTSMKLLLAPSALRLELSTVPPPSGKPLQPLVGLVLGLAKKDIVQGRPKYEGPLLSKAALAVKVPARDAVFLTDTESLELLLGEREPSIAEGRLRELGLKASTAGEGQPFLRVDTAEALKEGMKAAASGAAARGGRPLHSAASTLEGELLDLLADKCNREFEAGLALSFAAASKPAGVFRKLGAGKAAPEEAKVRTRLYEAILKGSGIFLGKEDVKHWMELLGDMGLRYADAFKAERDRAATQARGEEPAWEDLRALSDEELLVASQSAVLFKAALFRGQTIAGTDLRQLAREASEAIAAAVPAKYAPVPLPTLSRVYDVFRDAIDLPSDAVGARTLFEFFALLSLTGVTDALGSEALRRAQHFGDVDEVRTVKENYGSQIEILKQGLGTMKRIVAVLRLKPPLRTVGAARTIFDRYQLPGYALIP